MWIENHDRLDNSTPGLSRGICGTTTLSTYIDCISYSGNNPHPDPCQPDRGCRKGSGKCPYRHKDRVVILCWKCNFGVGRHWSKKQSLQSWRYLIVDLWCGSHHITTLHRCARSALFGWLNIYLNNASSMLMKYRNVILYLERNTPQPKRNGHETFMVKPISNRPPICEPPFPSFSLFHSHDLWSTLTKRQSKMEKDTYLSSLSKNLQILQK